MKRIGLLGGTFDPPHIGHLNIAKHVFHKLSLDEVWFIPTYEPPHKRNAIASPKQRLDMLQLLIAGNDLFSISTIEYELKGKSYTIDTIKQFKKDYPNTQFYFIIGGDMIDYLPKWYKIDELLTLVEFVGIERKGFEVKNHPNVKLIEMDLIDVSSTDIREQIKNNQPPYGLPNDILKYIRENKLYEY